jgi:hypothetical protein
MSLPAHPPTLLQQNTSIFSEIGDAIASNAEAALGAVDSINTNASAVVDSLAPVAEPLAALSLSNSPFLRAVAKDAFLAIASVGEKFPFAGPVVQALKGLYEVYQVRDGVCSCTPHHLMHSGELDGSSAKEARCCVQNPC